MPVCENRCGSTVRIVRMLPHVLLAECAGRVDGGPERAVVDLIEDLLAEVAMAVCLQALDKLLGARDAADGFGG